jgi:hypothetical protein
MTAIDVSAEDVVVEMLQRTGSCSLDDLVIQLPNLSWSEIFGAIDRMSRDGRLSLRRLPRATYHITLSCNMRHSAHHPAKEA